MYWQETGRKKTGPALYHTVVDRVVTKQLIISRMKFRHVEIASYPLAFEDSVVNPCANNPCCHICVQSRNRTYSCLCSDEAVLHKDGHNCNGIGFVCCENSPNEFPSNNCSLMF